MVHVKESYNTIHTQRYCQVCGCKRQPITKMSKKGNIEMVCETCGNSLKNKTVWTRRLRNGRK